MFLVAFITVSMIFLFLIIIHDEYKYFGGDIMNALATIVIVISVMLTLFIAPKYILDVFLPIS